MTSLAARERTHLCALAQQVGPDAPTLCGDWDVKDLVVHLLAREGSPAAIGIVVPPLSGLMDREMARLGRRDFAALVTRLRHGPPFYSPFSVPRLGDMLNLMEYFIHHEDIRRAQPTWSPRDLPERDQDALWRAVRTAGRGLVRKAPVGVVVERSDTGEQARLAGGDRDVVVRGLPAEIALYVYGRKPQARVELVGDDDAVASLGDSALGV